MTQDADQSPAGVPKLTPPRGPLAAPNTIRACISCGVFVAMVALVITAIVGLRMALHATVITCPNGTTISTSDPNCYAHKHAGQGMAIFGFSVVLIVLVALAGFIAHRTNDGLPAE